MPQSFLQLIASYYTRLHAKRQETDVLIHLNHEHDSVFVYKEGSSNLSGLKKKFMR